MKYKVNVIFGKEQVIKLFRNESLSDDELSLNVKNYTFKSLEEKRAFIKGLDEAVGWTEYCIYKTITFKKNMQS